MEEIRKTRITFFINLALTLFAATSLVESIKVGELWRMIFATTGLVGFALFAALTYAKLKRMKEGD